MTALLELAGIVLLFAAGTRLAAFFTGNEAGFRRVSLLRLSLDARSGDRDAARLARFASRAGGFEATALIGSTLGYAAAALAMALFMEQVFSTRAAWGPLVGALAIAPALFVFCELAPAAVYERAPMRMLRRDSRWFRIAAAILAPIAIPLTGLARLASRRSRRRPDDHLLGHARLVQAVGDTRDTGRVTDVQARMIHGLFRTASQPVTDSMTPASRILGVPESATLPEALDHARRYGLSAVPVRRSDDPGDWFGYLRVVDLAVTGRPPSSLVRPMPRIAAAASKLESLIQLREAGALYGAVTDGERVAGIVHVNGLTEQVFRGDSQAIGTVPGPAGID